MHFLVFLWLFLVKLIMVDTVGFVACQNWSHSILRVWTFKDDLLWAPISPWLSSWSLVSSIHHRHLESIIHGQGFCVNYQGIHHRQLGLISVRGKGWKKCFAMCAFHVCVLHLLCIASFLKCSKRYWCCDLFWRHIYKWTVEKSQTEILLMLMILVAEEFRRHSGEKPKGNDDDDLGCVGDLVDRIVFENAKWKKGKNKS